MQARNMGAHYSFPACGATSSPLVSSPYRGADLGCPAKLNAFMGDMAIWLARYCRCRQVALAALWKMAGKGEGAPSFLIINL
jgi:hypothetical protein